MLDGDDFIPLLFVFIFSVFISLLINLFFKALGY